MAALIAGMASSHAYTFYQPSEWDARWRRSRDNYVRINGEEPPVNPLRQQASLADDEARFAPIRQGLDQLKAEFDALAPDVLMVLGDDQGENYVSNIPQFALYAGERVVSFDSESGLTQTYACDAELARELATSLVEQDFDLTVTTSYPDDRLTTHAHAQILNFLRPTVPVLLVFVNAVCMPAPSPRRCYQFGQALGRAIERTGRGGRIVAYASGGLSHFSSDYPLKAYGGPLRLGAICEPFDARVVDWIERGEGERLAELTARDLIENGALEHRQWIALAGMVGARRPDWFVHGAFYRAIMNMGVAYWRLQS